MSHTNFEGIDMSAHTSRRRHFGSMISSLFILASIMALLIAPSIPSATFAVASVALIAVAALLSRFRPRRSINFKALRESAYSGMTAWGPYGDFWDIF